MIVQQICFRDETSLADRLLPCTSYQPCCFSLDPGTTEVPNCSDHCIATDPFACR